MCLFGSLIYRKHVVSSRKYLLKHYKNYVVQLCHCVDRATEAQRSYGHKASGFCSDTVFSEMLAQAKPMHHSNMSLSVCLWCVYGNPECQNR